MSSSTTRARLHHRPFAVLSDRLDHTPPPTLADTVRAEVRALVGRDALGRRDGEDLLARLGLHTLPYRWAVGATMPVTVDVRAPNDRYAARVGTAQLLTVLGRLRTGYLADPEHLTGPTAHPAARSLRRLLVRRTDPCPGYPVGGIYTVAADALLAITVTADQPAAAWTTARHQLTDDIEHLSGIAGATHLLRRTGLRRLGDLDHATDNVLDNAA